MTNQHSLAENSCLYRSSELALDALCAPAPRQLRQITVFAQPLPNPTPSPTTRRPALCCALNPPNPARRKRTPFAHVFFSAGATAAKRTRLSLQSWARPPPGRPPCGRNHTMLVTATAFG